MDEKKSSQRERLYSDFNPPRSVASAAQLLELWVERRVILDPNVLDVAVSLVQDVWEAAVARLEAEAVRAEEE